ncbi:MAG TPA: STAS domain-containing protein [Gaiellales bacterium]|nr:STAS domain-containing protein [Gaiellales bacterium]
MRGEHDISTAPALRRALADAAEHSSVLVDLSECSFIDSTVIGALLKAAQGVKARGDRFALVIPPEQRNVTRLAAMTRLADILAIHSDRDAAVAGLRKSTQDSGTSSADER